MKGLVRQKRSSWGYQFQLPPGPDGAKRYASKYGFATKAEAEAALAEALTEYGHGLRVEPSRARLGDWLADEWLPGRSELKAATSNRYRSLIGHVQRHWIGSRKLQEITAGDVTALLRSLRAGGLSGTTAQHVHRLLSAALSDAVKAQLIRRNPVALVDAPRRSTKRGTVWTPDQTVAFLDAVAGDRHGAMWAVAATTGMRRGELAGMAWDALDLDAGTLRVERARVTVNYRVVTGTPKTEAGARTLALEPEVVALLRAWRATQAAERLAAGPGWVAADGEPAWLWTNPDGSPIHPETGISDRFERIVAGAGLPRIRLHDLRHGWATFALTAGESPLLVAGRLGHASAVVTQTVYAHLLGDQAAASASRVNGSLLRRKASVLD